MNKSPFDCADYRFYLNYLCTQKSRRGFRAALAREAGCQASYLSQVLKGRVHFTEDQLLLVAMHLDLSKSETEYLLLQLRFEKAGTKKLRNYLQGCMEVLQGERTNLVNRVDADETIETMTALGTYFSSWIPSAVHLLTSSPHFQKAEKIAARLHLPLEKVQEILVFLEANQFIERQAQGWSYLPGSFHIRKDSPFQPAMQATRRELAARSSALNPPQALHFSSLFTIEKADLAKLQEILREAIERSQKTIHKSGTDRLACFCVDLFEVV